MAETDRKIKEVEDNVAESETEVHLRISHTHKDRPQLVVCSVMSVRTQGHESNGREGNASHSGQARQGGPAESKGLIPGF